MNKVFAIVILVSFLFALSSVCATTFLDVFVTGIVQPSQNIAISGQMTNDSASDEIANVNITATMTSGGSGSELSDASGNFNFNITAPSTAGEHLVTVTTNESTQKSKTIPVFVSNVTGGSIAYVGKSPPFSVDTNFTISVTLLDGTTPINGYEPNVTIFKLNGPPVTWTITNQSSKSNSDGNINYTVTIPASATTGHYVIVVERGAVTSVFNIKSGYIVLTSTETTSGETSSNFAPGTEVMILAKIKTSTGVAAASAASSVDAYITLPNGTVENITLTARNQTTYPGYYNNSYSGTPLSGTYDVRVDATIGSAVVQGYTFFDTKTFSVKLENQEDFFMEWGGTAAFAAGGTVGLNVVAINLSSDNLLTVPGNIPACNSTYVKIDDIFYVNKTSINSTITDGVFLTGFHMMNQICRVKFTGPSDSGIYGIKVNLTVDGVTETGEGYFSMQKYFLKPAVVLDLGGEFEFEKMVAPGENTTISLSAYNITAGSDIDGTLIQNVEIQRIVPLEFGNDEITTDINYTVSYGAEPMITLQIPSSILGPASVDIRANISDEEVIGNAFFLANYLMGELFPTGGEINGEGGGGMEGEEMGGPPFSSCEGTQTFMGTISEVKTSQAVSAGSVIITDVLEATEEITGKDVSSCVDLVSSATSGSEGSMSLNLTFSSQCSLSGFYFVLLNASYQGNSAGLPAVFMCKRLSFWPEIYSIGGDDTTWRIAPTSGIRMSMSNITRLNDTNTIGNASIILPWAFNFNPGSGERILTPTSAFQQYLQSFTLNYSMNGSEADPNSYVIQNNVTFDVYPQNFTVRGTPLTRWPNGFIDMEPSVCAQDLSSGSYPWTDGCDSGFGGFQVVSFDAWIENFPWGQPMSVNSTKSFIINAKTNVSRVNVHTDSIGSSYFGANNTGFTVKLGKPWEGSMVNADNVTAELISDNWNGTEHWETEQWRVNFTIPATIKKGQTMILITVNNSNGERTDTEGFTSLTKYSLVIPYEEGVGEWWSFDDGMGAPNPWNISVDGWNMTAVNETLGIWSRSGTVCNRTGLTVTRWAGSQSATLGYNSTVKMLIIDNSSAGYDTIVFNNSGVLSYVNSDNRTLSENAFGHPGLYLRAVEECHYAKLANATATTDADIQTYGSLPSWAGEAAADSILSIPYIVKLGSSPVPFAEVHVNGIAKQGWEGFGFEEKLTEGINYTYTKGTTDAYGVAFLRVNVTDSGRYNLFWKVNTSLTDYDKATFETGTSMEIRKFRSWSDSAYWLSDAKGEIYYTNSQDGVWGAVQGGTPVYNATFDETDTKGFIRDSSVQNGTTPVYFIWVPGTNRTHIDDDKEFDSSEFEYVGTINFTSNESAVFIDGPGVPQNANRLKILYNDSQRPNFGCNECTVRWAFYLNGTNETDHEQMSDQIIMTIDVGSSSYTSTFFKSVGVGRDNTVAFKTITGLVVNVTNATNATGVWLWVYVGGSEGNYDYTEGGNILEGSGFLNETIRVSNSNNAYVSSIGVNYYANTSSGATNKYLFTFYQEDPKPSGNTQFNLQNTSENITMKVCTKSFGTTSDPPIEGVIIKLYSMQWRMMGPPQQTWLTLYDPVNASVAAAGGSSEPSSNIRTGPTGCVVFRATHPSGWPECSCTDIQGTATRGSDVENLWGGRACTPCQ